MTIFEACGILLIAFSTLILLLLSLKRSTEISRLNFSVLILIFMFGILILAYNFDPQEFIRWDLAELFKELEQIKIGGLNYCFTKSPYKTVPVSVLYFYLISLTDDFHLLPIIPLITEFSVFLYIMRDQIRYRVGCRIKVYQGTFIFFLWFSSFGLSLAISGIRSVWGVSLGILALYLDYYKRTNYPLVIILYAAGIMIHPFLAVILLIRVILFIPNKYLLLLLTLPACLAALPITGFLLQHTSLYAMRYALGKFYGYWGPLLITHWFPYAAAPQKLLYLSYVMIIFYYVFLTALLKRKIDRLEYPDIMAKRVMHLATAILVVLITGLMNRLIAERLMMMSAYCGVLLLPSCMEMARKSWFLKLISAGITVFFLWLLFFENLYLFLVNFTGRFFLSL